MFLIFFLLTAARKRIDFWKLVSMDQARTNGENEHGSLSAQVHVRREIWPQIYFEQDGDTRCLHTRSSWFHSNVQDWWSVFVTSFSQVLPGSQWRRHRGSSCQFGNTGITKSWCYCYLFGRSPFPLLYQAQQDQDYPLLGKVFFTLETRLLNRLLQQQKWTKYTTQGTSQ